ncbi:MAG TPA: hypothetical protein VER36_08795, partial [Flavisolibacter sp.]|nr:hypothetical protein [Flavisolibacter sp.]
MYKSLLTIILAAIAANSFAQADSSAFYLQKALEEKTRGRRMEVVRQLEKAYGYNKNNQQVVSELAAAYLEVKFY